MIHLQWPWILASLPLPLLVRLLPPAKPLRTGALRVPFFREIGGARAAAGPLRRYATLAALSLIWLLVVVAAARPTYVSKAVPIPVSGRDLMLAVDLSGSMARQDFSRDRRLSDRLSVVKAVADEFIARRVGDRVGLILFSSHAYVQAPLTFDRAVVRQLLGEATIGLTGQDTAIGDAIGLAVKTLQSRPPEHRMLVLLTDGVNNSGVLDPLQAAEIARQEHVKIYTIGVGADSFAIGQRLTDPAEDLDETGLAKIAELTGGRYFRARDTAGLSAIYADIDRMEPAAGEPRYLSPTVSLFHWPLGLALVLSFVLAGTLLIPAGLVPVRSRALPAQAVPARPGSGARP